MLYLLHLQGEKGEPGAKGDTGDSVSCHSTIYPLKTEAEAYWEDHWCSQSILQGFMGCEL